MEIKLKFYRQYIEQKKLDTICPFTAKKDPNRKRK